MSDVVVAVGLLFALEGALYALFPALMKRIAAQMLEAPADRLRMAGLFGAALGVALVWMVRG